MADGQFDPALWRGLTQHRLPRRTLLKGALAGLGVAALGSSLAGCSIQGSLANQSEQKVDWKKFWADQKPTNQLNFANWPLYIDQEKGKYPSLELFTEATGIKVNYQQVIQNNAPFYAAIAPQLRAHQNTGYDIIVMTNGWEFTELVSNGFVMELDHTRLPNFAKYASSTVTNPPYDPGNKHSVAYQSTLTGIAYNTSLIKREITSFADLMDPAFKGHVGMMNDNTELGSAGMLALGIDPATSTRADWLKAAAWLKKQAPYAAGYYDQSYIDKLQNGDTWISQAWAGDIFQAIENGNKNLKFVVPKEGLMVSTDNMMIPMQAQNPLSALSWMNFYYTPKIAGMIADWVAYVSPVPAAKEYILNTLGDPAVANSELVFPSDATRAKFHNFYVFKNYDDYDEWNKVFNPVIQS
jgi:spermidine/putrescine transport system substrate-binding protein